MVIYCHVSNKFNALAIMWVNGGEQREYSCEPKQKLQPQRGNPFKCSVTKIKTLMIILVSNGYKLGLKILDVTATIYQSDLKPEVIN